MSYHEETEPAQSGERQNLPTGHRYVMRLLRVFPADQAVALRLIEKDSRFRELCDEYEACNEAIERLTNTKFDRILRKEYDDLQGELEGELLRFVLDHQSTSREP